MKDQSSRIDSHVSFAQRMGGAGKALATFFAEIAAHNLTQRAPAVPTYHRIVRNSTRRGRPRMTSDKLDYAKGVPGHSKLAKRIAKGTVGLRHGA